MLQNIEKKMKILLVHNNYGKYSGEEAIIDKMEAMFSTHGHEEKCEAKRGKKHLKIWCESSFRLLQLV